MAIIRAKGGDTRAGGKSEMVQSRVRVLGAGAQVVQQVRGVRCEMRETGIQ